MVIWNPLHSRKTWCAFSCFSVIRVTCEFRFDASAFANNVQRLSSEAEACDFLNCP